MQYIMWAPDSSYPPKKVFNQPLEEVLKIAETMVQRYGGKFYVAELVGLADTSTEGGVDSGVLPGSSAEQLMGASVPQPEQD